MLTNPAFEAALDADPSDQVTRAVYADWLGERGEEMYAAGLRWMVENNRFPLDACAYPYGFPRHNQGWVWLGGSYNGWRRGAGGYTGGNGGYNCNVWFPPTDHNLSLLPDWLFAWLPGGTEKRGSRFDTRHEAEAKLCQVLGWQREIDPSWHLLKGEPVPQSFA